MNETEGDARPAEMLPRSRMVGREECERSVARSEGDERKVGGRQGWVVGGARRQKLHDNFSSIDPKV